MTDLPPYSRVRFDPVAAPETVVVQGNARFSILTSRLIRMEYAPDGRFEDRPSQAVWFRRQPVPDYEVRVDGNRLEVVTDHLRLIYDVTEDGFSASSLSVTLDDGTVWYPGMPATGNLRGTTRTLDKIDGAVELEPGLLSTDGWAVVDDSHSLLFGANGWLTPRESAGDARDWYFFGYGRAYRDCLRDFRRIAGGVPLLPRWALGNWWSRYWAYSADELLSLMEDFRAHDVPLSVCIIDMDWHLVDVGEGINGWTGYTWNTALFPEPAAFIARLHAQGLKTSLNLHPALGVRPHEAMYEEMARSLGRDPASGATIAFNIADPRFADAYLKVLHHPQEANGVDFWWMDWQQGTATALTGLDPLWWLNHLHFHDLGRDGRRPFIFSRWGGLGNHRYPIGFSGDTVVSWASLAFQPYFTATAANVGYDWWSHDIGGHMHGTEEPELFARWVQFGVFSPILRLHSTKMAFHERRPWGHDAETFRVTRDAMQLRHALIPYLYTMSRLDETEGLALVRPMYHEYPEHDEAYACPQQYLFGTELLVAPFTSPADPDTRLARQVVWLPPGDWYSFFTGEHFAGDAWHAVYGALDDIPVFARAGGIIPLASKVGWGGVDNPTALDVHLFAGADGRFVLYEDDGESTAYRSGAFATTTITQRWSNSGQVLKIGIGAVSGDGAVAPARRSYNLHVHGVAQPAQVTGIVDGATRSYEFTWDGASEVLEIEAIALESAAALQLTITAGAAGSLLARRDRTAENALRLLTAFRLPTLAKYWLSQRLADLPGDPELLTDFLAELTASQSRALLEVTQGVGLHHTAGIGGPHLVVMWNNHEREGFRYHFTELEPEMMHLPVRYRSASGRVPRFQAIRPARPQWRLTADYFGLTNQVIPMGGPTSD